MKQILILILSFISINSYANENKLINFLQNLNHFKANFKHVISNKEATKELDGTIWISAPNKLRWDYENNMQKIIADGEYVRIIEEDLEQVTQYPQKIALQKTPIAIFLSKETLINKFNHSSIGEHKQLDWILLKSKNKEEYIKEIIIGFNNKNQPERLQILDEFNNKSYIFFSNINTKNIPINIYHFMKPDFWDTLEGF